VLKVTVCEQVIVETEQALARRAARSLPFYRRLLRVSRVRVARDPLPAEVQAAEGFIAHQPHVVILAAAMKARTDFLVTLNRRHFIDDLRVAQVSGLRIGTPGDALAWVRKQLT
jgi:hypothetical protein